MPSLFSRSRTTSSPSKSKLGLADAIDEFGRVANTGQFATTKKDKRDKPRSRTLSTVPDELPDDIPDGTFLPLNLNPPNVDIQDREQEHPGHDYGYLSYKRHVVLGLDEVVHLVDVVAAELGSRGLTTPFIFTSLALDVSAPAVKRLIEAFLQTCHSPNSHSADRKWREEAKFAAPHELGICLRWGLARVVRIVGGQEVRGLLSYESYVEWKDSEIGMNYPLSHFGTFVASLDPVLHTILVTLLTLLIRFIANSTASGHTPPTLSPLFGPLFFGLGPPALSFHHAYHKYLRSAYATEHIFLAFIRWQDSGNGRGALGVPARLKDWIRGYPVMLPAIPNKKQNKPQPRTGARTVRVVNVRRNVRMYSPDLVKTAASWGHRPRLTSAENSLAGSKEWDRIAPRTLRLSPRYSDNYRKRMNLAAAFHPDTGPGSSAMSSHSSKNSTSSSIIDDDGTLVGKPGEDRFRSLTDLRWGEFEAGGFGSLVADDKKLQFDLTEGARAARAAKRTTLTWTDFSSAGFSRMDAPLNTTLQFSAPVTNSINQWPAQAAELTKRLKKTQKALPAFGWDTEPVMAAEEVIEEAFVDVFCDLVYGGGWMDLERSEEVDRECNWALVEFKALPISTSNTVSGTGDPRSSTTLILFEEFVPYEYRQQLSDSGRTKRRLQIHLFAKSKQWKPATTLNGRPYVIGSVPPSPHFREVEFEGILRGNGSSTRILRVDSKIKSGPILMNKTNSVPPVRMPNLPSSMPERAGTPAPLHISAPLYVSSTSDSSDTLRNNDLKPKKSAPLLSPTPSGQPPEAGDEDPLITPTKRSRFRLPVPGPASLRHRSGIPPAEYENVDFETRLASYSDDELNNGGRPMTKEEKRRSRDDAWVDILVSTNGRRMAAQDAKVRDGGGVVGSSDGLHDAKAVGRSDPGLASQEVARALAAAKNHPMSDDEDEVVIAPRPSDASVSRYGDESEEGHREIRPLPAKPRSTYFDLHPERRPVGQYLDDIRLRLEADSDSELDYASIRQGSIDISRDSHGDDQEAVTPVGSSYPVDNRVAGTQAKTEQVLLPAVNLVSPVAPSPRDSSTRSKTAALIEMYREKERLGTSPVSPITTSPTAGQKVRALPLPPSKTPPAKTPPPRTPSPLESEDDPLSKYDRSPTGPGRYVHGAPLHNVLEEEDEM